MSVESYIQSIPTVAAVLKDADHVDIKTFRGEVSMRAFIAGMIAYQPKWVTFLYGVRWFFVRMLGMKQSGIPHSLDLKPEKLPMTAGEQLTFFTVEAAEDERFYVAAASESHLTARLCVVVEPLSNGEKLFHVVTIVHYNHWTGPVYFNVIRPFHHVVVYRMAQAGVNP